MKKFLIILLALSIAVSVLVMSGCASTVKASGNAPVKTGMAIMTSFSKSKPASSDADGLAQMDMIIAAVTVGDDGLIDSCVIDTIQTKVNFTAEGVISTDLNKRFPSKNALGGDYGMKAASAIGKEWNEQAAALSVYIQGKTIEQVSGIALDENGKATEADIISSVTVSIDGYIKAVVKAAQNATHSGASKGDTLKLESVTKISKSKDAKDGGDGLAQAYATIGALTLNDQSVITSCAIDAIQANVNFDSRGEITSDLAVMALTKNELGEGYGMKAASSIGKEWNEQAAAFAAHVKGKKITDAIAIPVEDGKAVDLTSSATINVDDFIEILAMASK